MAWVRRADSLDVFVSPGVTIYWQLPALLPATDGHRRRDLASQTCWLPGDMSAVNAANGHTLGEVSGDDGECGWMGHSEFDR